MLRSGSKLQISLTRIYITSGVIVGGIMRKPATSVGMVVGIGWLGFVGLEPEP